MTMYHASPKYSGGALEIRVFPVVEKQPEEDVPVVCTTYRASVTIGATMISAVSDTVLGSIEALVDEVRNEFG